MYQSISRMNSRGVIDSLDLSIAFCRTIHVRVNTEKTIQNVWSKNCSGKAVNIVFSPKDVKMKTENHISNSLSLLTFQQKEKHI